MEFNSQICTTVEQSKRLMELGLKKWTADMWHYKDSYGWQCSPIEKIADEKAYLEYGTPAWSLHRLMEIMYNGDMFGFVSLTTNDRNIDTIYELVIANIEGLIKIDKFNKDYLEEKK